MNAVFEKESSAQRLGKAASPVFSISGRPDHPQGQFLEILARVKHDRCPVERASTLDHRARMRRGAGGSGPEQLYHPGPAPESGRQQREDPAGRDGASSISLEIPESAGCEIRIDGPLTRKRFTGFTREQSGLYRTGGFEGAEKKIFVDVDAGVSSIRITRYGA
jgi:hypothetical protein